MSIEPGKLIGTKLSFHKKSCFNFYDHDGRIRDRRYAGEHCLSECVIERHNGQTPGVMVWGVITYHRRSNLLRIEGNLNSNCYVREELQLEAFPFLQGYPGAIFQQNNARQHVCKDCSKLQYSPTHATSSLACCITGYVADSARVGHALASHS
ncbi:transposable element Tc1 transposase [Trichonephila clavipes]|nr:transposable element Tc1 transposase [Trichonephila clavipes]